MQERISKGILNIISRDILNHVMGEKIPKKTPKIKSYNCDHCDKELSTKDAAKQHEATCGEGAQNKILTRYQLNKRDFMSYVILRMRRTLFHCPSSNYLILRQSRLGPSHLFNISDYGSLGTLW